MAEAITTTKRVTVNQEVVQLTLTKAEAATLRSILTNIGGSSERTRRGHADSISRALDNAAPGLLYDVSRDESEGSIYFK